ncbi:hypothetical protein [Candidatus Protochlamydia phocaeensis]|uniref:hypothetical protein n=1 Tax=Candidatus Protochlamydia phocaeensis TaxID=1414722 RepID=UPI000838137E|nr:hypothetical protein [Candidatus Protochlamydia phocaeensis]
MSDNFFSQIITRGVAAFLCTLSLWTVPAPIQASCCESNPCCETDECCGGGWFGGGNGRTALVIGGAAVVGGIAGAIAGNASSHRGHRGRTGDPGAVGPIGPVGPTGATPTTPGPGAFTVDAANTLTFAMGLTVTAATAGSIVTPFVERPDGVTLEGTPVAVGLIGTPTFAPITITDPVYGTYHAGLRFTATGLLTLTAAVTGSVFATRDSSVTNIGVATLAPTTPLITGTATQAQITLDFTYDALTIP